MYLIALDAALKHIIYVGKGADCRRDSSHNPDYIMRHTLHFILATIFMALDVQFLTGAVRAIAEYVKAGHTIFYVFCAQGEMEDSGAYILETCFIDALGGR